MNETSLLLLLLASAARAFTPFIRPEDMTGIWKFSHQSSLLTDKQQEEIFLRLNEDGTFDPYERESSCTDDMKRVLDRGGFWEYRDDTLFLAPERPPDADPSKVHDTVLAGKLSVRVSDCLTFDEASNPLTEHQDNEQKSDDGEIDVHLSIADGNISIGKFMYPRKHKAFFDDPMLIKKASVGSFSASQILGNLNARLKSEREEEQKVAKFHKQDFHGRKFYLTATPHPVHQGYAKQDKRYDESKVLHDFRALPITFHYNNTFSAFGSEKILRGRYGLTGDERDRLWFQVSLFGAGRTAPGSVFSEGRLLSHDDRRGYLGTIQDYEQHNMTRMFVEGEFFYGTDLKRAIKPNSMGVFTMQEINADSESDDGIDNELSIDWGDEDAFQ